MRALAAAVLLAPGAALAQDVDCTNAQTQVEMTYCASVNYEQADAYLNDAYAAAIQTVQGYDGEQEALLRAAQRAWIAYRDAACSSEASLYEGGTAAPMVGTECKTRLTEARTADLWAIAEPAG